MKTWCSTKTVPRGRSSHNHKQHKMKIWWNLDVWFLRYAHRQTDIRTCKHADRALYGITLVHISLCSVRYNFLQKDYHAWWLPGKNAYIYNDLFLCRAASCSYNMNVINWLLDCSILLRVTQKRKLTDLLLILVSMKLRHQKCGCVFGHCFEHWLWDPVRQLMT